MALEIQTGPASRITHENYASAYTDGGYQGTVRYLLRFTAARRWVEDFAQEAWARGWQARSQFTGAQGASITTWVNAIARNVFIDYMRRRFVKERREIELAGILVEMLPAPGFMQPLINAQVSDILSKCDLQTRFLLEAHYLGAPMRAPRAANKNTRNTRMKRAVAKARKVCQRKEGLK